MADNINTSITTTMSSSTGAPTSLVATGGGGGGGGSKLNNNNHNKNHNNSDVLKSGSNKHGNVIHRTTSESLRLGGDNNMCVNSASSAKNAKPSKTSSFQITSVTLGTSRASGGDNGDDSADDLDTDDNSRITDLENETPSFSEDTFSKEDVFFANNPIGTAPVIPTSSQYGLAIVTPPDDGHLLNHNHNLLNDIGVTDGGSIVNLNANLAAGKNPSEVDLKELSHRNERFKVVKIESTEPFKRGRWVCMDYLDHTTLQQSKQEGDGVDSAPQSHAAPPDTHSNNNVAVTRDSGVVVIDNNIDIESMPNSATHIQNDMSTSSPGSSANPQNHQNMEVGSLDSGILNNGTLSAGSSSEQVIKQNHHAHSMINIPLSSTPSNISSNVPNVQQHHHHPQTLSQFNLQKVNITTQPNDMPQTPPPQQQQPQQQQQLHPSNNTGAQMLTSPAGAVLTNHAQGATLPSNLIYNIGNTPPIIAQQHHQPQSQQTPTNPHHNHHPQNHQAMSMVNISIHENSPQSHQSSGAIAAGAAANQNLIEQQQQTQLNSNTQNINNNNNNNNNNNISHTPDGGNQQQQYILTPTSLSSQTSMSISPSNQQSTSLPATMTSGIGTPNNNNNNTVLNQEGQVITVAPTLTTTHSQPATIVNNNLVNEINEIAASTINKTIDDGQLQQQISTTIPGGIATAAATEESSQPTEDGESASGTSAVAIDNKIEQAMDLVKSHLMFAVREEVEVLKEKIAELMDRINQLEIENTILKANATQETLSQLSATVASSKIPPANPANGPVS